MQAAELRIGNKIFYNGKIIDVKPIHIGFLYEQERMGVDRLSYKPIPLTPEILEESGFRSNKNSIYWNNFILNDSWYLSEWVSDEQLAGFERKGSFYWSDNYIEIKYVHDLQNLYFALYKTELTINL